MAKKLDIAALMGDTMSKLNTATMQVQDIPLDLIDTNPDNKYQISGIEDLAESISVVGLLQPLDVYPVGDRYMLLAGERRYTAVKSLGWANAPCVLLDPNLDPAIQTLILHWTNTMARGGAGLTGDVVAGAALEIEAALVDLKQRGVVDLPGKLREHVAAIMQVSESTLARAKAIDNNLIKAFKGDYACHRINDSVAYELSQCDKDLQRQLHGEYKDRLYRIDAKAVKAYKKAVASGFAPLLCPATTDDYSAPCIGTDKRAAAVIRGECPGCCFNCEKADGCEWVCGKISKQHRAAADADAHKREREQKLAEFEQSPLNRVRLHMRDVLGQYGATADMVPDDIKYRASWIWTDNPLAYGGVSLDVVFQLAEHIGVDPQELLFGNPEGAPLRELALGLDAYCDRSLPYDKMISDAARKAAATLSRVEAERNAAVELLRRLPDSCCGCKYSVDGEPCQCVECDDANTECCTEQCPWWGDPCGLCDDTDSWTFCGAQGVE